jgi:hypothetical protein
MDEEIAKNPVKRRHVQLKQITPDRQRKPTPPIAILEAGQKTGSPDRYNRGFFVFQINHLQPILCK